MKALLLIVFLSIASLGRAQSLPVYEVKIQGDDHFPKAIRFLCSQKYAQQHCLRDVITLQLILGRYPVANLGTWNFALASSDEWSDLVRSLAGITGSPAFSVWENRTTVLEEALFSASGRRRAELIRMFGKADEVLLEQAVSHELGHVLCGESNENRAARNGQDLFVGKTLVCHASTQLPSVEAKPHELPYMWNASRRKRNHP